MKKFPPCTDCAAARHTDLAFAVGDPSFEVASCPRFDMAPITSATFWVQGLGFGFDFL